MLTAHYDHLGIGRAEAGDSIYNGAVDNCTASALLLALAQAYARTATDSHPTLVFVAADAEEEGLLGSAWQARHPAVPLERIRGVVTFEMANPWGRTRDLMVIGAPRAAFARWLEPPLAARRMRMIGDLVPEQGFLFRSDQLAWLQAGVPAAWVNGGMDYEGRPEGWGAARQAEYRTRDLPPPGRRGDRGLRLRRARAAGGDRHRTGRAHGGRRGPVEERPRADGDEAVAGAGGPLPPPGPGWYPAATTAQGGEAPCSTETS